MWKLPPVLLTAVLLFVPTAPAAPVRAAGPRQAAHIIRPGDTLTSIAARHDVSVANLRRWNSLPAGYTLRIDGMLRLTAPAAPLPVWRTRTETVTATEANGDPNKKCPVAAYDLRRIWVRYLDFQGVARDGNLIMHRELAVPTQKAFAALYRWRFPVLVMQPAAVNMPGLTDKSILTSGYECRYVAGTTTWSQHSYGRAIDVNPRQNPMIRGDYLDPPNSATWLARDHYWPGMLHADGGVPAFTSNGFAWGGRWITLKDYMHFSPNNR
ncbi:M15 family metallopeptidase [Actinoplanes sp. NPDC051861]|uniref:M15 family metallopeptidase n=1 Tax=Actinoplanes sp. NPDC051861 TaxID=3155170 RepID=UPI003415A65E